MPAFNVEVFDRSMVNKFHDNISEFEYKFDYLAPSESTITVTADENVIAGDFIHIHGDRDVSGVITSVKLLENGEMQIGYKPVTSLFDVSCVVDTNWQGTQDIETVLTNLITNEFISNSDSVANVPCFGTITKTSSTQWGFNLKSASEGQHHLVTGLYDTMIVNAFRKLSVVVNAVPDYSTRKINFTIGQIGTNPKTIEADLPNVLDKSIMVHEASADTNKLTVINESNWSQRMIYYVHPDGSYNTTNTNRITPVVNVYKSTGVDEGKTFAQAASAVASDVLGNIAFNNLIEIEVFNDDEMINAENLRIGQTVSVIHNGYSYNSILSGKKVGKTTTLTFGCIRIDLTKLLKTGGING